MKNFRKDLKKHAVKIINYEKKKKKNSSEGNKGNEGIKLYCKQKFVIYAKKNLVQMTMTLHSKNTISMRSLSLHWQV